MCRFFKDIRKKREFNAKNCRNKQNRSIQERSKTKISEIKNLIEYKVLNSNYEKTIIFTIDRDEEIVYDNVIKYFIDLGFTVLKTEFEELGDQKFLIISWAIDKDNIEEKGE